MEKNLQKKIVERLKKGDASLVELVNVRGREKNERANVIYNIRMLCGRSEIRPYLKLNTSSKSRGNLADEIWFTFTNNYQYPMDIIDLIDQMRGEKKSVQDALSARQVFVSLYTERGKSTEAIRKERAITLMLKNAPEPWQKERIIITEKMIKENPLFSEELTREKAEKIYALQEPSEEKIKREAETLAELLMSRIPGLKEKVAFCLTHRDKEGAYPYYDKALTIKFE